MPIYRGNPFRVRGYLIGVTGIKTMILIAGLGNPGTKYLKTLHNVGFMAVELLAEKNGAEFDKKGFKGLFGTKTIGGEKVVFLKPQTFMNLSGESIREIAAYFKIPSENILVIYDDIDIDIGALRIRKSGAAGTHNGMRNIVGELGTENFPRIRIGTKPQGEYDILSYVLSDIKREDEPKFRFSINEAVQAANEFIHGKKFDDIMCAHNGKKYTADV